MVKEIEHNAKTYYQCEACNMYYEEKEIAQKCEDFCNKFKSCDTELISHAVILDKENCNC